MPAGIDTAVNPAAICEQSKPKGRRRSLSMKAPRAMAEPTHARKPNSMTTNAHQRFACFTARIISSGRICVSIT